LPLTNIIPGNEQRDTKIVSKVNKARLPFLQRQHKQNLVLTNIIPGNEQRDTKIASKVNKARLPFLQRQHKQKQILLKLTVEKYSIHNLGEDQWKVNNNFVNVSCS